MHVLCSYSHFQNLRENAYVVVVVVVVVVGMSDDFLKMQVAT